MQLKMFVVRDSKSNIFGIPQYAHTHAEAERHFTLQAKKSDNPVGQFPEDHDLYYVGTYDTDLGTITAVESPQHVAKAITALGNNAMN
ncbi:nonstructural protein [Apis mellifera associated microvirus 21]|nr:nonstructural protein [Apis mellifera associated microvirus 21]